MTEQCKVELVISIMLRFLHFYFFTAVDFKCNPLVRMLSYFVKQISKLM